MSRRLLVAFPLLALVAGAQTGTVTSLKFRTDPDGARVRPYESLVVQVQAVGEAVRRDGKRATGRLRKGPSKVRVVEPGGGWVSKPFKYQGSDTTDFVDQDRSTFGGIFSSIAGDFVLQDSVLYTAPEKPGKYTIEAELDGVKGTLTVEVSQDAPSTRPQEKFNFSKEDGSAQPYRALAQHWAPMLAQETWFMPKADVPTRFDFDGDVVGDNNWDRLDEGTSQAYVYYAVMETETHWFLIYNAFHPRDYSDKCVVGTCHENDNEGLILTILKDGSQFGKLQVMETLAHNNVYSYTADSSIRSGLHNIEGPIEFYNQTHPVVFIESGGHGIYGSSDPTHSGYNLQRDEFKAGTGITFIYKGVAERPKHANDRLVGYDLLSIHDHWWWRACETERAKIPRMFDDYGPYEPFAGRPRIPCPSIGRTFLGRKHASNKAKPFWGWHDERTLKRRVIAAGQWGLDPAYSVSQNLRFPATQKFSLDYIYNPYLDIDKRQPGSEFPPPSPEPEPPPPQPAQPQAAAATPAPSTPSTPSTAVNPFEPTPLPPADANLLPAVRTIFPDADLREAWIEIRATIDGTVVLHVRGSSVSAEVLSGQPVRDGSVEYSYPLPSGAVASLTLDKKGGRGTAALVEQPSAANGFTAKIRVEDPRSGSDRYTLRLRWPR